MYLLNEKQALRAMIHFVDQFADRAGDDLATLVGDIYLDDHGHTFDPAAWDDWLDCVKRVVEEDADLARVAE